MNACPAITILALRSCLSPRIGRSLALRRPVVGLDLVVDISVGAMPGRRQQLLEHCREHRRVVGDHLDWRDPIVPMAR
jgi:hypothetical protein